MGKSVIRWHGKSPEPGFSVLSGSNPVIMASVIVSLQYGTDCSTNGGLSAVRAGQSLQAEILRGKIEH